MSSPPFLSRHGRERGFGPRLRLDALHSAFDERSSDESGPGHHNERERSRSISHGSPLDNFVLPAGPLSRSPALLYLKCR